MGTSPLLRRPVTSGGPLHDLAPDGAERQWLSLRVERLAAGGVLVRPADDQEALVLVLEGRAAVRAGSDRFGELGSRASVFDGPPPPVALVEPGRDLEVVAASPALVAVAAALGGPVHRTAVVDPASIFAETRGSSRTERRIHHLLPPAAEAGRLIAFEVFTAGGNWSSYPPHKHDTEDPPREAYLEELYLYRFARPTGFAVQRVYTADGSLDETLTARDLDLVLVPRGYHVVGAAAGYDCYYLNVIAGPGREWRFTVDPEHTWLMDWDPARPRS